MVIHDLLILNDCHSFRICTNQKFIILKRELVHLIELRPQHFYVLSLSAELYRICIRKAQSIVIIGILISEDEHRDIH